MNRYELEHEALPEIRRAILALNTDATYDRRTAAVAQDALFAMLALVHDLTERVEQLENR